MTEPVWIKLKIVDGGGTLWAIPAEVVPTKFRKHRIVVHKSLSLDENTWTVTHEATGAALIAPEPTKQEAIDASIAALKPLTAKVFDEKIDEAICRRAKLTVGEYVRTGLI